MPDLIAGINSDGDGDSSGKKGGAAGWAKALFSRETGSDEGAAAGAAEGGGAEDKARQVACVLLDRLQVRAEWHQLGLTKVFLKREALEDLERRRTRVVATAAQLLQLAVQRWIWRFRWRRWYVRATHSTTVLQALARQYVARTAYGRRLALLRKAQSVAVEAAA
eukprot:SAG11_NODE_5481_length_1549_cov_1.898621_1_plen_164_part_10